MTAHLTKSEELHPQRLAISKRKDPVKKRRTSNVICWKKLNQVIAKVIY